MASTVGMTIRAGKANERIDAALEVLAAGSNAPARPEKVRDPLYNDVLRLEWIADTLEALTAPYQAAQAAKMPAPEPDEAADAPNPAPPKRTRGKQA